MEKQPMVVGWPDGFDQAIYFMSNLVVTLYLKMMMIL